MVVTVADVHRRHDLDRAAQVVEHHHGVGDGEAELGQTEVVGLAARQPLEAADDVVTEPADRAPEETGQAGRHGGRQLGEVVVHEPERVGDLLALGHAERPAVTRLQHLHRCPTGAHHRPRPHAGEAVGSPLVAAHDALQQEGVRSPPQLGERGHRRVGVREHLAVDEREPTPSSQVEEPRAIRDESHGPATIASIFWWALKSDGRTADEGGSTWPRPRACRPARARGGSVGYHGAPNRRPPLRAPRISTCARSNHPAFPLLDAPTRQAAVGAGASAGDPRELAHRQPLPPPAQRDRGAPPAFGAQRGGDRRASPPHGRAAVPRRPGRGGQRQPPGRRRALPR